MADILLGAGDIYLATATDNEIPASFFTDANKIGTTYGGATLDYKPTIKEIKNDKGEIKKTKITVKEISLKCGLCEIDSQMINKIACIGTYTPATTGVNAAPSKFTIGINDNELEYYALGFKHVNGDISVSMIATNKDGFSLAFNPDMNPRLNLHSRHVMIRTVHLSQSRECKFISQL